MHEIGKQIAGQAAAALVQDGMVVGLGTGTTVRHLLDALGARVRDEGLRIVGVPTSAATAELATRHRIPLTEPGAMPIDLALDGADEIEHGTLRLIKGLGGALLREKVVAEASARFVVLADASKMVPRLGHAVSLPVEVDQFAHVAAMRRIAALGGDPVLRRTEGVRDRRGPCHSGLCRIRADPRSVHAGTSAAGDRRRGRHRAVSFTGRTGNRRR
jgi:ribose 5-phosphate isomerase A